jgi:hypothetical protein
MCQIPNVPKGEYGSKVGIWNFEFGYYLLFVFWCLGFYYLHDAAKN